MPLTVLGIFSCATKRDLFVGQAALTGESLPVEKVATNRQQKQSNPLVMMATGIALPFTPLASYLQPQPLRYLPWLVAILAGYMTVTQAEKGIHSRRYGWQ